MFAYKNSYNSVNTKSILMHAGSTKDLEDAASSSSSTTWCLLRFRPGVGHLETVPRIWMTQEMDTMNNDYNWNRIHEKDSTYYLITYIHHICIYMYVYTQILFSSFFSRRLFCVLWPKVASLRACLTSKWDGLLRFGAKVQAAKRMVPPATCHPAVAQALLPIRALWLHCCSSEVSSSNTSDTGFSVLDCKAMITNSVWAKDLHHHSTHATWQPCLQLRQV